MATLGELERSVMERLWASAAPLSAYDIQDALGGDRVAAAKVLGVDVASLS